MRTPLPVLLLPLLVACTEPGGQAAEAPSPPATRQDSATAPRAADAGGGTRTPGAGGDASRPDAAATGAWDLDRDGAAEPDTAVAADWTIGVPSRSRPDMQPALLEQVRFGRHDGFDRLVLQFDHALPGWHLEYIDHPVRACGSGQVVDLPGDAHLLVRTVPATGHTEAGEATVEPRYAPDLVNVIAVARTCDFEGEVSYVLGLHSPTPFRVLELEDPPRLVVDVRLPKRLQPGD